MRYSGCAALDLAYVASGRLDGFFHNKINLGMSQQERYW